MERITNDGIPGKFRSSDGPTNSKATRITAKWMNELQDEILAVIALDQSLVQSTSDDSQMLQAIERYFKADFYD